MFTENCIHLQHGFLSYCLEAKLKSFRNWSVFPVINIPLYFFSFLPSDLTIQITLNAHFLNLIQQYFRKLMEVKTCVYACWTSVMVLFVKELFCMPYNRRKIRAKNKTSVIGTFRGITLYFHKSRIGNSVKQYLQIRCIQSKYSSLDALYKLHRVIIETIYLLFKYPTT